MHRTTRLIAGAFLLCFAGVLGGCSSIPAPTWDPTDLLDFLDTKKKAPGERKPVFPEGVPGISQGVPKEMVRGSPESRAASEAQAATPPVEAQPVPPPAKRSRTAARRSEQAPADQSQVEIAPDDVNVEEEAPPPPPRRQAQRPQRAPQPQAEPQASPFPAPLPR